MISRHLSSAPKCPKSEINCCDIFIFWRSTSLLRFMNRVHHPLETSFVCYVTFFISCSPRDLPAQHATLKNSCKTKTTIDFLACYFDLWSNKMDFKRSLPSLGTDNILMSGYGNKCQNAYRGKLNKWLIKLAGERIWSVHRVVQEMSVRLQILIHLYQQSLNHKRNIKTVEYEI